MSDSSTPPPPVPKEPPPPPWQTPVAPGHATATRAAGPVGRTAPAPGTPGTATAVPGRGAVASGRPMSPLPPPPPVPPLFASWWASPAKPRRWVLPAVVAVGVMAALLVPAAPRPGLNVLLCALAAAVPVALVVRTRDRGALVLGGLAVALCGVAALRDSEWFVAVSVLGAMCLGVAAAFRARSFSDMVVAGLLFPLAVLRAVPWVGRDVRVGQARPGPWLTGAGVGGVFTLAIGGLLASADAAFASFVDALLPSFTLDLLVARVFVFVTAASLVLGGVFAAATRQSLRVDLAGPERARHPAEWLMPLVLVAATIGAFLAVEATMLFGDADVVIGTGETHAGRAREGFGQLVAVTVLVLALLAWAARWAAPGGAGHRRQLGVAGGLLTALTLLLAGSALRRLWLYQEQYGATVTRIVAGSIEVWLAFVLLLVVAAWLVRRTRAVPRLVVASAATVLLALGAVGPDAAAARWNVDRFERTGKIDSDYLSVLSADAVPSLQRLPDPLRGCVLRWQHAKDDPWYAWNLSRARAAESLRARPAPASCVRAPS